MTTRCLFSAPTRPGGSYVHEGEEDDTERCREWLLANCETVEQTHLPTLKEKLASVQWDSENPDYEELCIEEAEPVI